jgi:hypothetical protein
MLSVARYTVSTIAVDSSVISVHNLLIVKYLLISHVKPLVLVIAVVIMVVTVQMAVVVMVLMVVVILLSNRLIEF